MKKHINRRNALSAGTAAAGLLIGTTCSKPEQIKPPKVNHPPFLTPWSPPADLKRDLTPGTTPIRLAARTRTNKTDLIYSKDISITEMVKSVRDMGYTASFSKNGYSTKKESNRNPWLDASESEIRELKEALKTYDVSYRMRSEENLIHPDLSERRKIYRYIIEECEAAERCGCPSITTIIGTRSNILLFSPHKDNWTWETWRLAVKTMKQILKDTSGMKVELGVESVNMTTINNPRAHLQLIEEVADPRCKVTLDPVNMINLGNYFRTTELINECFDLLGENIAVADAKDTYVLPNKMSVYITQVVPGEGMMDYETYLVRLSRLKYPRTLNIEDLQFEQYPAAKKFIEKTAENVGITIYN